ncbi:hypothetical protein EYF80_027909 [Liparis tanakae]|uniref:Uncharacterized protein n=1 Tax=Liparis tanakae TaxID=230148 RepID=A0A4Z2HA56_9TELE|nr:hypothetical protein EYF80_027909 [Liparis tanakae]
MKSRLRNAPPSEPPLPGLALIAAAARCGFYLLRTESGWEKKHRQRKRDERTHQKLVRVRSSSLPDKDPGAGLQLHLVRGPLQARHLGLRVAVEVELHHVVPHGDGETSPGVHHGGHREPGRLVRRLRAGLRVVQDDVLVAALHGRQLDGHVHDLLRGVRDGEDNAASFRGGFQVEAEGEVSVEWARQVGAGQLARVGLGAEDIARPVVGPVDPGDRTGRRIPNQLLQGDSSVF